MNWIYHNQYREKMESSCTEGNELLCSIKCGAFLTGWGHSSFSRTDLFNFLRGAGNFGSICSACGQRDLQYTEWSMDKCNFTSVLENKSCAIKIC